MLLRRHGIAETSTVVSGTIPARASLGRDDARGEPLDWISYDVKAVVTFDRSVSW
jgi:hypothetical protein